MSPRAVSRGVAFLALFALGMAMLRAEDARAHGADPVGASIVERAGGVVSVALDAPESIAAGIAVALPVGCVERDGAAHAESSRVRRRVERTFTCASPLAGQAVEVRGMPEGTDGVLRVETSDGSVSRAVVRSGASWFSVPTRASSFATLVAFAWTGIRHLASGLDHLLFIAGLALLARRARSLVAALTAFTVGHSLTLAASVLHVVKVPAPLAEIAIALSLVFLGVRVVRAKTAEPPLRLAVVAASMGLLHGLGFAYALAESGLPEGEVPLALFGFNVGIEVGQLGFVLALVAVAWCARRARVAERLGRVDLRMVAGYGMGGCATMWCIERVAAIV